MDGSNRKPGKDPMHIKEIVPAVTLSGAGLAKTK